MDFAGKYFLHIPPNHLDVSTDHGFIRPAGHGDPRPLQAMLRGPCRLRVDIEKLPEAGDKNCYRLFHIVLSHWDTYNPYSP